MIEVCVIEILGIIITGVNVSLGFRPLEQENMFKETRLAGRISKMPQ